LNPGMSPALITTPFGFETTAADVVVDVDLSGQRAIVTGAASGIGVETARALASAGAAVTLAVRDSASGQSAAADIRATTGNHAVTVAPLDLADLHSVAAFVAAWNGPLDILVNNAGVMAVQELTFSSTGHEIQFATNHLGHFALAVGLHDALAAAGAARIVAVSSSGHLRSPVVFDDIDYAFRDYEPFNAYGQSKTANVLFAVEATRRWAGTGITANALMPGGILTALQRHLAPEYGSQAAETVPRRGYGAEDRRAGCFHLDAAGRLTSGRRGRRPLLRELRRGAGRHRSRSRHVRRRSVRPRPGECRTAVGAFGAVDRRTLTPGNLGTLRSTTTWIRRPTLS
jgi:NAD(P)-dependent dehydrogenase (short-subunit alcohol dehydrogenase family)